MASEDSRAREQSLALRIESGDRSAEQEVVEHFRRGVFLLIYTRVRDIETTEDLAQDTFIHVLEGLRDGKLREKDRLAAYVAGTARNVARTHLRNQQRRERLAPSESHFEQAAPDLQAEQRQLVSLANRCLIGMSKGDRQILRLSLFDELTPTEIAGRLRIQPTTARQRKLRALKRFREIFLELSRKDNSEHRPS